MPKLPLERRDFLKAAAAAAAAGAACPAALFAADSAATGPTAMLDSAPERAAAALIRPQQQGPPPVPLGNGEHPALIYQAYPGGTGALYEKWHREGVDPFQRTPIDVPGWQGAVPTHEEDIAFLPVHRLSALIRDRHMSSVDLTELYLARLERYNPTLNCAVTILAGHAREEAQQADADLRVGNYKGPLHGVPYGVKDLFSVRGAPTTWGSAAFADRQIHEDADLVVRLREAGAVLLAKLATGEFAQGDQWYRGRTNNPWNIAEGSSGSSAGPGSATAGGCVGFAIGTETQGSIVSPSRRTGLSALRPTFGRVTRAGAMVLSWSMDKAGPMCRSIEDCALVFNTIHGASDKDPSSITAPFAFDRRPDLSAMRIGFTEDAPKAFLDGLEAVGARLREINPIPRGGSNALNVESASAFDFYVAPDGVEPEPLPEGLSNEERRRRGRFRGGRDVRGMDYVASQRRRLLLMNEMAEAMEGFDMFVSGSGEVGLTNQTGHPAAIVPYGFGPRNPDADRPTVMPLTTTLIGDLFADDKILSVAHAYQASTDWHLRRPDMSYG
ncbi:MAG: amidase [Gemmatimonadetes bacterium]|jgi:Asp-tRNA(Asn)/Glu-tRNA(Gln) amidotransferase A subunit family amidase|nr:amidase [Gemmatimonadota bacterium]